MPDKSAIIVGPELLPADIDYGQLPGEADVLRYGPFQNETSYCVGARVDVYLLEDVSPEALRDVANTVHAGAYEFGTFLYQRDVYAPQPLLMGLAPVFGAKREISADLAQHPALAQFFVSGYRPSPPMLLLAWALCAGYQTVYLLLPGFNPRSPQRFALVEARAQGDEGGRARTQAQVAADVQFVETLRQVFPEARIYDATQITRSFGFWPRGPALAEGARLEPQPKSGAGGGEGRYFKTRKNTRTGLEERCAYVTFCDSEAYFFGCRALARSLAQHSDMPLVVMVPRDFAPPASSPISPNVVLLPVPRIRAPHAPKAHQARFANTYSKLNVFGLGFLDKAIFIDSDALVFANIDVLFDEAEFAAAPDHGLALSDAEFNSGVFVCQPDRALFEDMLKSAENADSRDAGDQGFLNTYFPDGATLPQHVNVLKRVARTMPVMFQPETVSVLHYVGDKPWDVMVEAGWDALDRLWLNMLSEDEKVDLILWMRGRARLQIEDQRAKKTEARALAKAPQPTLRRAEAAFRAGDLIGAIEISKAALKNAPKSEGNKRLLRHIYRKQGRYFDALGMHLRILTKR